jgi:putative transposase
MPRPHRCLPINAAVHVTNRGNDRRQIFLQTADYEDLLGLMRDGLVRHAVDVIGYNAMPNHVHFVLRQQEQGAISAYMHQITCITARNFRWATSSSGEGHVFQRRFWSRVVTEEQEFVILLKYVEANAKCGGLVERAEDWRWGSLWERAHPERRILTASPVALSENWVQEVNLPLPEDVLTRLRSPIPRGRPRTTHQAASTAGDGKLLL